MLDVVVIGGGPAGAVCAAQLARRGARVCVVEKTRFPRFHLGESLLPHSLLVLEEIGVLAQVDETFLPKHGARFHDDIGGRQERFSFDTGWRPEPKHAYQVPRDAFDHLLLRHARACGADVREEHTVTRVLRDGARACGVEVTAPRSGALERIEARFVVDASGRDALFAHDARATATIPGLDQTAIYAHFEGIPRAEGLLAGDIDIVMFRANADARPNWFWLIPFKDGRTSVGAVVSRAWIKEHAGDREALFRAAVAESKTATEMLASAKMLWPRVEATADFSYRVRELFGEGWLAIGDAGGFIDPLFSTGAHIAMVGGKTAADAILATLDSPSVAAPIAAWSTTLRSASETFIAAVQAFYAGPLVDQIFAPQKHEAIRRSITSLLAGDVFHDAIWLRDARRRLGEWSQVSF